MRNKFAKLGFISLALAVAFLAVPVSYACVTGQWGNWHPDRPITYCTPQCAVAFTSVHAYDNEGSMSEPKEVAQTTACIKNCGKKIVTTVNNAYPGYEGYVNFTVKNTGRCPIKITDITIKNLNPGCLQLNLTGECVKGAILQPGDTRCGLLVQGIAQQAAQNAIYTFTIEIDFVQHTTCEVGGTPGYWQNWSCGTLNGWLGTINARSQWLGPTTTTGMVELLNNGIGWSAKMKDEFPAWYLAMRLNVESGRISSTRHHNVALLDKGNYLGLANPESATVLEVISAVEGKYGTSPSWWQFDIMKNICDALNEPRI